MKGRVKKNGEEETVGLRAVACYAPSRGDQLSNCEIRDLCCISNRIKTHKSLGKKRYRATAGCVCEVHRGRREEQREEPPLQEGRSGTIGV